MISLGTWFISLFSKKASTYCKNNMQFLCFILGISIVIGCGFILVLLYRLLGL